MAILFEYLNIGVSFIAAVVIATVLAFIYIAVAGIRAPAWVSVMKDILLVCSIIVVGIAAIVRCLAALAVFSTRWLIPIRNS